MEETWETLCLDCTFYNTHLSRLAAKKDTSPAAPWCNGQLVVQWDRKGPGRVGWGGHAVPDCTAPAPPGLPPNPQHCPMEQGERKRCPQPNPPPLPSSLLASAQVQSERAYLYSRGDGTSRRPALLWTSQAGSLLIQSLKSQLAPSESSDTNWNSL